MAAEYNLDYIPAGCVLYTLYDKTCEPRYRKAIETLEEQLRHQPRTPCGSFWHKAIYPNQVWLDGLYMELPFHANYAIRFGDESALDDIMLQFRNARKYLYDEKRGSIITPGTRQRMFSGQIPKQVFLLTSGPVPLAGI